MPNGTLLSEKLINWTLSDMNRRIDVNVGVAYGSDPHRVLQLLMEVAPVHAGHRDGPGAGHRVRRASARARSTSRIRAWTNDFGDWVKIRSALTVRVHDALKQAGIEIPFPQHDLHLRSSIARGERNSAQAISKPPVPGTT